MSEDPGDKTLTYKERFQEECTKAIGMCYWDRIVDSFKSKSKKKAEGNKLTVWQHTSCKAIQYAT